MPLVPLLTHYSPDKLLYMPYFSTAQLNASTISTGMLTANTAEISSLYADYISSGALNAATGSFSTFSTSQIVIDSQTLNATPTELLLNGVPIATLSSLSSIADWSYEPAISTVQMDGNDLNEAGLVSSLTIRAGNGLFNNLVAFNSLFVSSNTSTISSVINSADLGIFSTIQVGTISSGAISSGAISAPEGVISSLAADFLQASTISCMTLSSLMGSFSTLEITGLISTPDIEVSTINGAAFGASSITVNVAGVSSLFANSISSIGAQIREALISTIVFSPSLNPSLGGVNVNLGLGGILGNVIGWGAGVFGAAAGVVALGTSVAALMNGRQDNFIDQTKYELVNGITQLQFSTLGVPFSTIYRFNNSVDPERVPGEEIFISTVSPAGLAVRSMSDPMNTLSTPSSTIQSFGQWVPVPLELASTFTDVRTSSLEASTIVANQGAISSLTGLSTINGTPLNLFGNPADWALFQAISTIEFSTSVAAVVRASPGSDIALTGVGIKLIGAYTDAYDKVVVSTISTGLILGANNNLFGIGAQGLEIRTAPTGTVWISSPQTNIAGFTNTSTVGAIRFQGREAQISSLAVSSLNVQSDISTFYVNATEISTTNLGAYSITCNDISTAVILGANSGAFDLELRTIGGGNIYLNTSQTTLAGEAITSTLKADTVRADRAFLSTAVVSSITNNTLTTSTLLATEQIFVGPNGLTGAEIIFFAPNSDQHKMDVQNQDRQIRYQRGSGAIGYFLDTSTNYPFFSTINNTSTALMAYFPSSINSTIGVSTLSFIPVSFQTTSAFSGTILYPNISSSAVAANVIASTTIQTNSAGSYIIAQANTSFQNTTNQYHDIYLNLAIDGVRSPSTFTSLPAGINHYANGSIAYRQAVSSGTHTLVLYASADANGVAVGTQVDIWGTGNLAP